MDALAGYLESCHEELEFDEKSDAVLVSSIYWQQGEATYEDNRVASADLEHWLEQGDHVADDRGGDDSSLRIVRIDIDPANLRGFCINQRNYDLVEQRFDLKRARQFMNIEGFVEVPATEYNDSGHGNKSFVLRSGWGWELVWSHDMTRNRTDVILWGEESYAYTKFYRFVQDFRSLSMHPLFMPLVCATTLWRNCETTMGRVVRSIKEVERRTKHRGNYI